MQRPEARSILLKIQAAFFLHPLIDTNFNNVGLSTKGVVLLKVKNKGMIFPRWLLFQLYLVCFRSLSFCVWPSALLLSNTFHPLWILSRNKFKYGPFSDLTFTVPQFPCRWVGRTEYIVLGHSVSSTCAFWSRLWILSVAPVGGGSCDSCTQILLLASEFWQRGREWWSKWGLGFWPSTLSCF